MKKILSFIIISMMAICAFAEDLYIGSFYVTTAEEEKTLGDGNDRWANRRQLVCDMFNFEMPDVLGIQSFTSVQLSFMNSRMKNYFNKTEDIFYNKKTVELDTCNVVEELPEGCTCSWAKLRKGEKAFYVFNMCLTPESSTTAANKILTAARTINTEKLPCFIVGYLGTNETKLAYSRMTNLYNDCYTKSPSVSAEYGTVNNFDLEANHSSERLDFVFASKNNVTPVAYGQLQYGYYTQEADSSYKRRLLSAHYPVMAKVTL